MIVRGSAGSGQCFNGRAKRVSWSAVTRNLRHVHLHIELVRTPIFREIGLAAWCDMNLCKPFSRILPMHVEGATCVVRFVVPTIVKFDDIWLNE
jgi:hypothetical protein